MTVIVVGRPPKAPRVLRTRAGCTCGCGGGYGYRPLFNIDRNGRPTAQYRRNRHTGEPLSRFTTICLEDPNAVQADKAYRAEHADWKRRDKA